MIIKEKIESMNVKINYFNIEKDKQLLFNYIKDKKIYKILDYLS